MNGTNDNNSSARMSGDNVINLKPSWRTRLAGMLAPGPQNAVVAPDVPKPYRPSLLARAQGFMVGAHYAPHYTPEDVHLINRGAPLVALTATLGALGLTYTMVKYLGVPSDYVKEVFAASFVGYVGFDRAIVGEENTTKALHVVQGMADKNTGEKSSLWRGVGKRAAPLALRFGMGFCSAGFTGGIIMQMLAHDEVEQVITQRYNADNASLFSVKAAKEAGYDGRITALQTHINDDQTQIEAQRQAALSLISGAPDATQQTIDQRLAAIDKQISDQQIALNRYQSQMEAERTGAAINGTTGHAGKGSQFKAAQIQVSQAQKDLDNLTAQRATVEKGRDQARQRDEQAGQKAATRQAALGQVGDVLAQDLTKSSTDLDTLINGRDKAFDDFKKAAENDASYRPRQDGLMDRMSALEEYAHDPRNGAATRGFIYSISGFQIFVELLALLWAMRRESTGSELMDAYKQQKVKFGIEEDVRRDMETALPRRNQVQALAKSLRPSAARSSRTNSTPNAPG